MKPKFFLSRPLPLRPKAGCSSFLLSLLFLFLLFSIPTLAKAEAGRQNSADELINQPLQITSRTAPVLDMAISADGRYIVYISGEEKPTALWLASADPGVILLPEKLAGGPSVKSAPAISADSRYVAYVDTAYDVKGDIYIIDREDKKAQPVRLTDRKTEDGGPCFSSDSRFLYFHQAEGNRSRNLFVLALKNLNLKNTDPEKKIPRPLPVETGGNAMNCALSADNNNLAFVSTRYDPSGDIFVLNTKNNTIARITAGPAIDMYPQWHENSRTLYFSRIGSDTNHDHQLSPEDYPVICRIETDEPGHIAYPVTPLNQASFKPYAAGNRIYFLSGRGGVSNCWTIAEEGYIRNAGSAADQLRTAKTLSNQIPYDPYKTLLAHIRVIEKFPDTTSLSARAGYLAAGIFQELDLLPSALAAYQFVRNKYADILPESVLSTIRQIRIEFQQSADAATRSSEKQEIRKKSLSLLDRIIDQYPGIIAAEARIESVNILLAGDSGLSAMTDALDRLDAVLSAGKPDSDDSENSADDDQKAQALFLKAQIYETTAGGSQVIETLRSIITQYPDQRKWVDKAVDRIISHILTDFASAGREEKIQKLNILAMENQVSAPPLAIGALNRIGDLYYETGELAQAKAAFQNVLDTYPVLTTQTAAARLSLAEILFREERFRAAIDLYEEEISLRDSEDRIYQLARQGYIRKNISAGEFLFRLGEIPSARSLFKELIDYDDQIVEAHRGYIKCAAVSGDIEKVLAHYRKRLDAAPENPVRLYCTGLCLTYLNTEAAAEDAKKRIEKAIRYDSSVEYFHQTLGYVYEVLETVYKHRRQLERALMSYQKAYFLNDHVNNAENAANLELNLGNIYYLMEQYGKAFDFYSRRNTRDIEFSDADTRIVFLKRYGESAFQNNDMSRTIAVFVQAVDEINRHIDPLAPARAFDKLNRYVTDTIIGPAAGVEKTKDLAKTVARLQSEQNIKAAELTDQAAAPPSAKWQSYKEKMQQFLAAQEAINKSVSRLAEKYNHAIEDVPGSLEIDNARENLANLTRRIQQALSFAERLVELKAEISDRLGLAYQENGDFKKAAETFEQVFSINEKSGNSINLARNRRSVAYNTYLFATTVTGDQRTRLLEKAADDFVQVLSLIDLYGVPEPAERKKKALIDISVSTSLDAGTATQAARGFSKIQEKRLAETFISRIGLELGNIQTARIELAKQLKQYPRPEKIAEKVAEKDLYGVSLLYHRAGLLDNSMGDFADAFEKFAVSAQLCIKLQNPVSAAQNITNMASAGQLLARQQSGAQLSAAQLNRINALDRQVVDLLSKNIEMTGLGLLMQYHNQMGIFYFNAASRLNTNRQLKNGPVSVEDAVRKISCQQHAVRHFTDGKAIFEQDMTRYGRKNLETATALYLNMGAVAQELGDSRSAVANYEKALVSAETGVFPDLKWRALAGLGQSEAALTVLSAVPFSRTGCLPGEIIQSFAALVFEKLKNDQTDAALHLAEKISELERYNRIAPYVRPQSRQDKAFFAGLYPRLEKIRSLEDELAGAEEDRRLFIAQRLENEKALLFEQMGMDAENLPAPFKHIRDTEIRDLAVYLMALSETIEKTAADLAAANLRLEEKDGKNGEPESENDLSRVKELSQTYQNQISRYQRLCEDAYYDRPLSSPPDFITLLAPEPFDVMDLAEILTDDDAVARIFNTGQPNSADAVFLITKDETTAFIVDGSNDRSEGGSDSKPGANILKQRIDNAVDWTTPYIAYENPLALDFGPLYPFALSAKHLERCINSRKPFKKRLLSVPPINFSEPVTEKYDINSYAADNHDKPDQLKPNQLAPDNDEANDNRLTHFDTDNFLTRFTDINTLLIANGPTLSATVPTEPGAVSRRFFAINPSQDMRLALERPLAAASALSLSVVNAENADHLYLTGHLFSIYGCPSLIFADKAKDRLPLVFQMLTAYAENSGFASLTAIAQSQKTETADTDMETDAFAYPDLYPALYMGYQGMNKKESAAFAKNNFVKYVKNGRAAFDNKDYVSAMVIFENALAVANEIAAYDRYLPDLYKYARESAYLAKDMDQALTFAKELADLFDDMDPESEAHAEALLRLGLMHAKKDNYEKAIPVIERAVDIMSDLPPDENLVRAVMDLGIVLENATSYETALSRFKTAADLSRTLNRSELLGEQYLNIGRVYDLRLNQYATAIKNYEKALEIYLSADDLEKIAESKLNIGRCYRLLGNFTEADRYYDQSLSLIKTEPDQLMLHVKILIEKANNAWFQGRYEEAFKYQRQCYEIAKKENFSLMRVLSQNTEGLIWWTLGNYDKALVALTNALADAEKLRIREDEIATTLNNMGLIYRDMGDYQKAIETFDQAIEIDTAIGSKWGLAYDFRNKGLTFLKLDQPEDAVALFDRAYEISTDIGNQINAAKAILGKGDALFALEDFAGAESAYQIAGKLSESMMIKETRWRSLFGLARVQITFYKDLDAAEMLLRESIEIIEKLRSDIKVNQLKENFIANKLSVYETLVQLLADKNQPEQAFEIAERSRARNFIDLLGGQDISFSSAEAQTLYKKQQIIKSEIETAQNLLATATTPSERETYKKSITDLEYDFENVMIEIQLQNPQLASMVSVPPVKTQQLISYLEPETALLSYYLLENEIFCWILRSDDKTPANRLKLIRIPADRAALEKKILEFRRIIQNLEPYEKHAADLYAQLMAPLTPHLAGVRTMGISPHGSLHYLSFATLRNEDSFLLDQYALFYVPSAAVLEYTLSRRVSRPYGSPKVLAVGNPDLGDPILDLPFAEQEVGSIRWNFPKVTILTRERATETWVVNNISDFDIIHIASHGEFDPVNPLMSSIKLADANARADDKNFTNSDFDGNLEAGEIFGLKINADMVFLSACQTGLGKISAGDDVVGLNRSFFYAGTHTVISSLWRVSDVSTAVMIKTFYRLYMNQNKADCLRQAALHVKTRYPHPGYWGAFTLVGDYY